MEQEVILTRNIIPTRNNVLQQTDYYKVDHLNQYPKGTTFVYSNLTPRRNSYGLDSNEVVAFGFQYFIKEYLIRKWNEGFFNLDKEFVINDYRRRLTNSLGECKSLKHFEDLHDLGYLPLKIKAIPEGTFTPMGVPFITIENTHPDFFWLTNYLETIMSNILWKLTTNATTAMMFKKEFMRHAKKTGYDDWDFVKWQGHDFSFRGMSLLEDASTTGMAHLTSFTGTDTIPAINSLEEFYNADSDKCVLGGSVNATEHSVMSMGTMEGEFETFKRLITEVYPSGIVSIVSDTWDFWKVVTEYLPKLKDEILARSGQAINRVVIRPDSGDPVDIICGTLGNVRDYTEDCPIKEELINWLSESLIEEVRENTLHGEYGAEDNSQIFKWNGNYYKAYISNIQWNRYDKQYYFIEMYDKPNTKIEKIELTPEQKGAYECLWETFGGRISDTGYKLLNLSIGLIYGDSIVYSRQKEILKRLEEKGFAGSNLVLGIGSFSYQCLTRDTYGMAMKATYGIVDGKPRNIYKDPKTDSGLKKSATGLLKVYRENGILKVKDKATKEEESESLLQEIFVDGKLMVDEDILTIRKRINDEVEKRIKL